MQYVTHADTVGMLLAALACSTRIHAAGGGAIGARLSMPEYQEHCATDGLDIEEGYEAFKALDNGRFKNWCAMPSQ